MMDSLQQQAQQLDSEDNLKEYRKQFCIPKTKTGQDKIYFCGHSLGLQPMATQTYINEELIKWRELGVEGHFCDNHPWYSYHETVTEDLAKLVGAKTSEVIAMNALTVNLHLLLVSFYQPTNKRYKILIEEDAFPSDRYAVCSHLQFHNKDPEKGLIEMPANSEGLVDMKYFKKLLQESGNEIALILLPGVQYKTGQVLPMAEITQLAKQYGIIVGWDLAHAIGNIPLHLHQIEADFAVWCHYKYINAGPGAIGGCFIHERYAKQKNFPRFEGWWGHNQNTRFELSQQFQAIPSAEAWQLSNPPILQLAALRAALKLFSEVGIKSLRKKSLSLFDFSLQCLQAQNHSKIQLITPVAQQAHGAQMSLLVDSKDVNEILRKLQESSIVCDFRKPNIIRFAAIPFYNTYNEVRLFFKTLVSL